MALEPPLKVFYRSSQIAALEQRCGRYGIVRVVKEWLADEVALNAAQHPRHPLDASVAIEEVLPRLAERYSDPKVHAVTRFPPRQQFAAEIRDFVELLRTQRPAREIRYDSRRFSPFGQKWGLDPVQVSVLYEIDRAEYRVIVRLLVDPPPDDDTTG